MQTEFADLGVASPPEAKPPRPTVTEILRRYRPDYLQQHRHELSDQQIRVLMSLTDCRTGALGGHWWECCHCGHGHASYDSCHDRHCPRCGDKRRGAWFDQVRSWVLPTNYFHAVFTVPHHLNRLIEANVREFYRLQFRATRIALTQRAADPTESLGGVKIGFATVLHTWGQQMMTHVHTHVVLAGGGFRLDGSGWVSSEGREFFLEKGQLADTYRDYYLRSLRGMHRREELVFPGDLAPLADEATFRQFLAPLETIRWVIDCGSPEHCHRPEAALDYLARYVVGSAISDARIVCDEAGEVTIRIKDYRQGAKRDTLTMSGEEFVRRFLLHVLPPYFGRVRYCGLLGNRYRNDNLAKARAQLGVVDSPEEEAPDTDDEAKFDGEEFEHETSYPCPNCRQRALMWVAFIHALRGWQVYRNTAPKAARERVARELAELSTRAYHDRATANAQSDAEHIVRPP